MVPLSAFSVSIKAPRVMTNWLDVACSKVDVYLTMCKSLVMKQLLGLLYYV
jgi:hypothetical protein